MALPSFVISVPIGSWNDALPAVAASLLAQPGVELKLALLDASQDARVAEALAPLKPIVAYHRTGPDKGQAAAIQEGWDHVEGDVYGWLNADDFLFPGALARAGGVFANHPDCGAVTAQSIFTTPEFHHLGAHPGVSPPSDALLRGNCISQPSTWVRAAALKQVGGLNTHLHYTMDWDLWVRLYEAACRFEYIGEALSGVVICDTTKTAQFNFKRASEIAGLVRRHQGTLPMIKSLVGFWQHHSATRSGHVSPITPNADDFFYAGQDFAGPLRVPFVHYGKDVSALRMVGEGVLSVSMGGAQIGNLSPETELSCHWPRGKAGEATVTPIDEAARIDRIEFL